MITYLVVNLLTAASAVAISVNGPVQVEAGNASRVLERFDEIPEGAIIKTMEQSTATLRLASGSMVRLGSSTTVSLTRLEQSSPAAKRQERIKVTVGKMWASVMKLFGDNSRFEVEVGNAVAGVRGTEFFVEATPQGYQFTLSEGEVVIKVDNETLTLSRPGESVNGDQNGLGKVIVLSAEQLEKLTQLVGGDSATLVEYLEELIGEELPSGHDPFRNDIVPPGDLLDSPNDNLPPEDQVLSTTSVTVDLNLP